MADDRLDIALLKRGLSQSREKAQGYIMAGRVYINDIKVNKPSIPVKDSDILEIRGEIDPYVSRGGHKLAKAIEVFHIDATDAVCLDIGSSTGGFTDVLLRSGAKHVYAIDVGYGQLDWKLRNDARVTVMERTNARYIKKDMFPDNPKLGVTDVSFISVKLILPSALTIIEDGRFIALIKPQFEAGRGKVGKKGVVRDSSIHKEVITNIVTFVKTLNWEVQALSYSPLTGPEGNIEFLVDIVPSAKANAQVDEFIINNVVNEANQKLHK